MAVVHFCLDFGNTRKKLGYFQDEKLINEITLQDDYVSHLTELLTYYKPQSSILSSVVNHDPLVNELLSAHSTFILLDPTTPLPFLNAYGSPKTLGNDRLALVAGLRQFYPNKNSLAISIGTCITYNFLTANHTFRGGAISPGVHLRLKSMHEFTDKLPLVADRGYDEILGFDTETSIRSGAMNGAAAEIDGMINRYRDEYGEINAVLTGGDTRYFARRIKNEIFADQYFTLKGLYAILIHNA
jgi:type III pantothenate kinase